MMILFLDFSDLPRNENLSYNLITLPIVFHFLHASLPSSGFIKDCMLANRFSEAQTLHALYRAEDIDLVTPEAKEFIGDNA